jgi:hypothetical protein
MNTEPSPEEINSVQHILARLQPGHLPLPIFAEVARLTVTPVIEIVPLKIDTSGILRVLLEKRDNNDPHWAGMLHIPGTIVLSTDSGKTFEDALDRIIAKKLKVRASKPEFVESIFCKVSRGAEVALIYMVEIIEEPVLGDLYDVKSLPKNIIEGHEHFIQIAVKRYEAIHH